jgi:hypothetical protein
MRSSIQPCLSGILLHGLQSAIRVYEKPIRFGPILGQEKCLTPWWSGRARKLRRTKLHLAANPVQCLFSGLVQSLARTLCKLAI